jgi:hypothetical protein
LTHGINLREASGPLSNFFGDPPQMTVPDNVPLVAAKALLGHLKAGRSVYVALDNIMHVMDPMSGENHKPKPLAEVEMLGHRFPRNDGPAWLAARTRHPLALWTTHCTRSGRVVITASPLVYPDPSLPIDRRVEAMSLQLYAYAEAAILEHPEAWRYWSHLSLMTVEEESAGAN